MNKLILKCIPLQLFNISLLLMCCVGFVSSATAETIRIGVLAENGTARALERWTETARYLTTAIDEHTFVIKPLSFKAVLVSIEQQEIDFFLASPSVYVTAQLQFGSQAIATMTNLRRGEVINEIGGVIFTNAYNVVEDISDLQGKRLMAVTKSSLGGWQAGYKAMVDYDLDPEEIFSEITFGGRHDSVVFAVQNDVVDVGMVRTGTLEELSELGAIKMQDFKIIDSRDYENYPFVCNTALYPEWPMSRLDSTSFELAISVTQALQELTSSSKACKAAGIAGWIEPLDYSSVEDMQRSLRIGVYSD